MTSPTPEHGQSTEAAPSLGTEREERERFDAWLESERENGNFWTIDKDELREVWWASSQEPRDMSRFARPEPPVEGALEEARKRAIVFRLNGAPLAQYEVVLDTLIAAARSGHDGLREAETQIAQLRADLGHIQRTAEDPWFYDGTIARLAARALSPEANND